MLNFRDSWHSGNRSELLSFTYFQWKIYRFSFYICLQSLMSYIYYTIFSYQNILINYIFLSLYQYHHKGGSNVPKCNTFFYILQSLSWQTILYMIFVSLRRWERQTLKKNFIFYAKNRIRSFTSKSFYVTNHKSMYITLDLKLLRKAYLVKNVTKEKM